MIRPERGASYGWCTAARTNSGCPGPPSPSAWPTALPTPAFLPTDTPGCAPWALAASGEAVQLLLAAHEVGHLRWRRDHPARDALSKLAPLLLLIGLALFLALAASPLLGTGAGVVLLLVVLWWRALPRSCWAGAS